MISSLSISNAAFTVVDADLSNTTIGGVAPSLGVNYETTRTDTDGVWALDTRMDVFGGTVWAASNGEDAAGELETTVTGLAAGTQYQFFVLYWSNNPTSAGQSLLGL